MVDGNFNQNISILLNLKSYLVTYNIRKLLVMLFIIKLCKSIYNKSMSTYYLKQLERKKIVIKDDGCGFFYIKTLFKSIIT